MTREDVKKVFPDVTDEQLKTLLDINTSDIGKAKGETEKMQKALDTANVTIKDLNDKIKAFDGTEQQIKELQDKVSIYEETEKTRKEEAEKAKTEIELKTRFESLLGEKKFSDEDIAAGRFNAFKAELAKDENKGKGDSELFELITKDRNCFVNPQKQTVTLPGVSGAKETEKTEFKNFF